MGRMGDGYGSECHLLRWMGRHRQRFDEVVGAAIGKPGQTLRWLDFNFDPKKSWPDSEWKGFDFLGNSTDLQSAWREFWPTGRGIQNWDAVGWAEDGQNRELLLVEAKAHLGEIASKCKATGTKSRNKIKKAFSETKVALAVDLERDWLTRYYQMANRLAALHFLTLQKVPARLVLIYFVGDLRGPGRPSPQSPGEWQDTLRAQDAYLGLNKEHSMTGRIHKIYLPVASPGKLNVDG